MSTIGGSGAGWLGLALWGSDTPHRAHLVAGLPPILGPHAPRVWGRGQPPPSRLPPRAAARVGGGGYPLSQGLDAPSHYIKGAPSPFKVHLIPLALFSLSHACIKEYFGIICPQ
jgi:hypothetical protein